ncbi:hypothetical protein [Candidatus Uabimicrobium amorphum]|uniref:Uncharacterized protein n=1 Tax=Uabimicrobium amorphum TaxID=2596890 RepID=A0A5S9F7D0_UABAM|nr:hypothetical protein [Candidatus Uabimicrobium amorphum]BBM87132.1 hypothetical protein UABAM_05535 [Candidatus Uabimicrobium amorphum]
MTNEKPDKHKLAQEIEDDVVEILNPERTRLTQLEKNTYLLNTAANLKPRPRITPVAIPNKMNLQQQKQIATQNMVDNVNALQRSYEEDKSSGDIDMTPAQFKFSNPQQNNNHFTGDFEQMQNFKQQFQQNYQKAKQDIQSIKRLIDDRQASE